MELIEGDSRFGQAVGNAIDEARAHVDADLGDGVGIAAMGCEIGGEGGDRVDRHGSDKAHQQCLEQQGEAGVRACPRHGSLFTPQAVQRTPGTRACR